MNKLVLFFWTFIYTFSYAQEEYPIKKAADNIHEIVYQKLDTVAPNIFITDIETVDTIVRQTKKKYKLVYFLSYKCQSVIKTFPILLQFINKHSNTFELLPIIGHHHNEVAGFYDFLEKHNFYRPVYLLDTNVYGTKKNPFKRIDLFTQALCYTCDYKKMGFSSFFVIDENNRVVLHNNWNIVGLQKIKQLEELVKNVNN